MRAGDADEDVDAGLFVFDALKVISSRAGRGGKAGAVSEEREFFLLQSSNLLRDVED